jgi:hypothetical protein
MNRQLYPREMVILALTFGVLWTFSLPGLWFLFAFGLLVAGVGVVCVARPQWLVYRSKTPERLAQDRISCRAKGLMLLPVGVLLLLVFFLSRLHR